MSYIVLPPTGSLYFKDPVALVANLPTDDPEGTVRLVIDDGSLYWYDGAAWHVTTSEAIFAATPPLDYTAGVLSITQADATHNGYLTSTDWNTFNNKGSVLTASQTETATGVGATGVWGAVTSLSVTAGTWMISGNLGFVENGATLSDYLGGAITASATASGLNALTASYFPFSLAGANNLSLAQMAINPIYVTLGSPTTYYLNSIFTYSAGTPHHQGIITALRIK